MAGLTTEGFVILTLPEVRSLIDDRLRGAFGPQVDVSDGSVLGTISGIVSERISEVWQLAEAVNASQDPDAAQGAQLDALAALTGTVRAPATSSEAVLTLTGTAGTVVPEGTRALVVVTEASFETLADATLVLATAWAASTAVTLGARRSLDGRIYQAIGAGTTGVVGPVGEDPADLVGETDGSVLWRYLGDGLAVVDVDAAAVETGPTSAAAGSITTIETPVGGLDSVVNVEDAVVGSAVETDENLRIRREVELAAPGTSPLDAIRTELLALEGVTAVTVFHNTTDTTDVDGVPPHAIEALVQGGDDQTIRDTLLDAVAAGIQTHGDVSGTATDDAGNDHTIKFSRPDPVVVYVTIDVVYDPDEYPEDGDDRVAAAIVAYGVAQKAGRDVVAAAISAQAFGVPGVINVTSTLISAAPTTVPVASTTIVVPLRSLADYDTGRIVVNSSEGTP